jgi:hypothetical protein
MKTSGEWIGIWEAVAACLRGLSHHSPEPDEEKYENTSTGQPLTRPRIDLATSGIIFHNVIYNLL